MTAELMALAERVEGAVGPDRELDAEIAVVSGLRVVDEGHPLGLCCYNANARLEVLPRYTASLDAALTLVSEGRMAAVVRFSDGHGRANIHDGANVGGDGINVVAATPALALTAACLRAIAQEQSA